MDNKKLPYVLPVGLHGNLVTSFRELLLIAEDDSHDQTYVYVANVLKQVLTFITLKLEEKETVYSKSNSKEVIAYFSQHLDVSLSLEEIAAHFDISKFVLAKSFKSSTGSSPIEYYNQLKMKKAKRLLDDTELTVKEIGNQLGFKDPYHFSRAFKNIIGLSPKQFRYLNKG